MTELNIHGTAGDSRILIGESIDRLVDYLPARGAVLLTDTNLSRLYRDRFPDHPILEVDPGEGSKTLSTAESLYRKMISLGMDRGSFLVGIGGGVVTDLAGYLAATYMRGISFGFVSTTLLGQVDASIGGKNGLNLDGYKNMIGTFRQPAFVICDTGLLASLPPGEWLNGWAEVIKHGLIADRSYLDFLLREKAGLLSGDIPLLNEVVLGSVRIKSGIVNQDEMETASRRLLNFGHTTGHALEKLLGIPHGRAVGLGMVLAARISGMLGLLPEQDVRFVNRLLADFGLPTETEAKPEEVLEILLTDKKKDGDRLRFIVLEKPGKAAVLEVPVKKLRELVRRAMEERA